MQQQQGISMGRIGEAGWGAENKGMDGDPIHQLVRGQPAGL